MSLSKKAQQMVDRLQEGGALLLSPYIGYRDKMKFQCLVCDTEYETSPQVISQSLKKHNMNACPACHREKRCGEIHRSVKQRLADKGIYAVHDDCNYNQVTTVQQEFMNIHCGHTFTSSIGNLLHGQTNIECTVCGINERHTSLHAANRIRYEENADERSEYQKYRQEVQRFTSYSYDTNKELINPDNLKLGLMGSDEDAYQLDHILPVRVCFELGICPSKAGNVRNLQVTHWRTNAFHAAQVKSAVDPYMLEGIDVTGTIIEEYNKKAVELNATPVTNIQALGVLEIDSNTAVILKPAMPRYASQTSFVEQVKNVQAIYENVNIVEM